ncbi:MAG: ABC transporter permease [Deltaproteobacteria bacterium]|jgi:taurine transport system permease protein|nr:ABC transporter permease [Deltaproteobacteria bacterium]
MSRRGRGPSSVRGALISVSSVALFVALWHLGGRFGLISALIMPPPEEIWSTTLDLLEKGYHQTPLWRHVGVSLARALSAFALAVAAGLPLGLAMGLFPGLSSALEPFVQFFRPLPKIALIPLAILWLGIGETSKIFLIFLSTLFTVVVGSAAAVKQVGQSKLRLGAALGANYRQLVWRIILPASLPEIFTSVRLAVGVGWTTLIASEMVAANSGMGWMVMNASSYMRTDIVMLGIILLGLAGYLLDLALVAAERLAVPWAGRE